MLMQTAILTASLVLAGALAGCSSAPKVVQAPESSRREANDPGRISMLAAAAELDRARAELALQRRTSEAQRLMNEARDPVMVRSALGIPVLDVAPKGANVVFTVRFPSGGKTLALSPRARSVLASVAQKAPLVMVRGRTDARQATLADERIARVRAEQAQVLLVQLGVPAQRIRATWQAAGDTVASLDTAEGRALNRRVEIEVYGAEPVTGSLEDTTATVARR
jgi:outer membrane protein OmpA-like peptidoglycan-associated protein